MKELFKNKELRKKILIIFAAMVFIRMGSVIPIPGIYEGNHEQQWPGIFKYDHR